MTPDQMVEQVEMVSSLIDQAGNTEVLKDTVTALDKAGKLGHMMDCITVLDNISHHVAEYLDNRPQPDKKEWAEVVKSFKDQVWAGPQPFEELLAMVVNILRFSIAIERTIAIQRKRFAVNEQSLKADRDKWEALHLQSKAKWDAEVKAKDEIIAKLKAYICELE